ncbi:MAG: OmpA family protein [bacterium]
MLSLRTSLLLLLIWSIFVRWYYVCQIKSSCAVSNLVVSVSEPQLSTQTEVTQSSDKSQMTLGLTEDGRRVLDGYEQIAFIPHSAHLALTPNNQSYLTETAKFVKSEEGRKLTIAGYYLSSEVGKTPEGYANIGLARAAAVRDELVVLGVSTESIQLSSALLDDVRLSKSIEFTVEAMRKVIPATYMIQK